MTMYKMRMTDFQGRLYFTPKFDTLDNCEKYIKIMWKNRLTRLGCKSYYVSWLGRKYTNLNAYLPTLEKQIEKEGENTFRLFTTGSAIGIKIEIKKIEI